MKHLFHALLIALLLASHAAWAQERPMKPEARATFERAMRLFQVRSYRDAIKELKEGYVLDPHPDFLYALAQAHRLEGDCTSAAKLYEEFLKTDPPEAEAAVARENLERCRVQTQPRHQPTSSRRTREVRARRNRSPAQRNERPVWHQDVTGHVLMGTGLLGVGAGIALLVIGNARAAEATDADRYDAFAAARDESLRMRIGAAAAGGAGLALVVAAIVRFVTVDASTPSSRPVSARIAF